MGRIVRMIVAAALGAVACSAAAQVLTRPGSAFPRPRGALNRGSVVQSTLIAGDAGTLSHVYWKNGALVDATGVAWTMTGTVPQVAAAGRVPAGAGGFSSANRYTTTATSDAYDMAGVFTVCIVYNPNGEAGSYTRIFSSINSTTDTQGWFIRHNASAASLYWAQGAAVVGAPGTEVANGINVLCVGYNGTQILAQLNLGSLGTAPAAAGTAATGTATCLGGNVGWGSYTASTIYEVWATTTTPTGALFTSVANAVKARGITSW